MKTLIVFAIFICATCCFAQSRSSDYKSDGKAIGIEMPEYRNGRLVAKHYFYPDIPENDVRFRKRVLKKVVYDKNGESTAYYGFHKSDE